MPIQPRCLRMLPLAPLRTSTTIGSQIKRSNRTDYFLNHPSKYYAKPCRRRGAIRNLNTPNRILVPTRQTQISFQEIWINLLSGNLGTYSVRIYFISNAQQTQWLFQESNGTRVLSVTLA